MGFFPPSSPQQNRLCHEIRLRYPRDDIRINPPIKIPGKSYFRYPDVGFMRLRIDFEYDGVATHRRKGAKESDAARDKDMELAEWWPVHVTSSNWKKFFKLLPKIVAVREKELLTQGLNIQVNKPSVY